MAIDFAVQVPTWKENMTPAAGKDLSSGLFVDLVGGQGIRWARIHEICDVDIDQTCPNIPN